MAAIKNILLLPPSDHGGFSPTSCLTRQCDFDVRIKDSFYSNEINTDMFAICKSYVEFGFTEKQN